MIRYPTRCRIIDADGIWTGPFTCRTPEESVPHIGKCGIAEIRPDGLVKITLDDGHTLGGEDCWWIQIYEADEAGMMELNSKGT